MNIYADLDLKKYIANNEKNENTANTSAYIKKTFKAFVFIFL